MSTAFLSCTLIASAFAGERERISLGEAAEHAVEQSKLTRLGNKPFHLKAEIVETTNPKSEYQAKVEQYWVSPEKWRRTLDAPGFSQTLIINGNMVFEQDTGEYFPWWLNDLVKAMVDPLPMAETLKQVNSEIAKPRGSENSNTCADLRTNVDRWILCFEGSHGLLTSAFTRGYDATFKDFKPFGNVRVARRIVIDPEPGTSIEASVTELTELSQPDDALFLVAAATPSKDRIKSVRIDEEAFRKLSLSNTDINWSVVGGGATTGGCAVYASADRLGHLQEVWPHGCDNPGLQDPLREIVKKWQLKPAVANGAPVQVEALLTFKFETKVVKSDGVAELTDAEARKLATNAVEPMFPPGSVKKGSEVIVRISVNEAGTLAGAGNPGNLSNSVFLAAYQAVGQWHFQPYVKNGKAEYFHANIVFHVR